MQDTEAVVTILSYCFVSALCLVVFFLVDNASSGGPWPTMRTKRTENLIGGNARYYSKRPVTGSVVGENCSVQSDK